MLAHRKSTRRDGFLIEMAKWLLLAVLCGAIAPPHPRQVPATVVPWAGADDAPLLCADRSSGAVSPAQLGMDGRFAGTSRSLVLRSGVKLHSRLSASSWYAAS